jgi:hypothetical protein
MGGAYYSTSFYLQRDASNYYSLFFLTNNLLGLERIVGVKWEIDSTKGEGFLQRDQQERLFREEEDSKEFEDKMDQLKKVIIDAISQKKNISNIDLYYTVIMCNFRAKHANTLLKQLQKDNIIMTVNVDGTVGRKGAFYLTYDSYSSNKPVIMISLNETKDGRIKH